MHGTLDVGVSRQDIARVNGMLQRRFRYTIGEIQLRNGILDVRKFVDGGDTLKTAIRKAINTIIPKRQKKGQNRKQAYEVALGELFKCLPARPDQTGEAEFDFDASDRAAQEVVELGLAAGDIPSYPDPRFFIYET